MPVFNRIFGTADRASVPTPQPYVQFQNPDGTERLLMVPDTSASAQGARHALAAIYGNNNLPPEFGMRGVVQVRDPETGEFRAVTGSNRGVPEIDAQIAALQSFRESGIIGPQPINPTGSNAGATASVTGATGPSAGAATNTATTASPAPSTAPALEPASTFDVNLAPSQNTVQPIQGGTLDVLDETGPTQNRADALNLLEPAENTVNAQTAAPQLGPNPNAALAPATGARPAPLQAVERVGRRAVQGIRASNQEGAGRAIINRGNNNGSVFSTF